MGGMPPIVDVDQLVKKFGELTAVDGVSFTVGAGEIFGFLGPNGAGKSTTIKILATLLRPTSGRATLAGADVVSQPDRVRLSIGLVFQDPSLDVRLTADENLQFHAMLYDVPRDLFRERADAVLRMVDLLDRRSSPVMTAG
jgi:ABC-2 type transport system ATP-binding protein